jgi:predicted CoA-binding protein
LSDIKLDFDIVNFVVKPEITLQILEKNVEILKNKTIWCQPGASDSNVEDFLKNNFTNYITESCIMIEDITKK